MDETPLFTIFKKNLETGLRGYPIGYCTTSFVHPEKGLFYAGHPVSEMEDSSPEEVIFLLCYGRVGSSEEVSDFKKELVKRAVCSSQFVEALNSLPTHLDPMRFFSIAILLLGAYEGTGDYWEDALNVIAKIPEVAARVMIRHRGWAPPPPSQPELGYMKNFMNMIHLPSHKHPQLYDILRIFNILHYDHGGGNLSAFVGKAVASGVEDRYGSLGSAMCALAGPRHGRANQDCLEFVQKLIKELGPTPSDAVLEKFLQERLAQGELIFGFGHAVLRVEDPRATLFYRIAEEHYSDHPLVQMALCLRRVGTKVLKDVPKISDPYPNVDGISGILLMVANFNYPDYITILFGLARVVGISLQIVYERKIAREGKGVPIYRPSYVFKSSDSTPQHSNN